MAVAASDKSLHLTVITPARAVFDAPAAAVVAPAFDGEVGVLPGHAPMMALLGTGEVRITTADGGRKRLAVRGGFLQVNKNKVTLLTPESITAEDIKKDALAAEAQKAESEQPAKPEERVALDAKKAWIRARQKITS
ncbi:MAG TPA: ATP synthase F1 subunit epsilon [Planctomycetota bacterium]|nr:ATP synthase F1 subunit epsilon [Planctomycetota bacterium]